MSIVVVNVVVVVCLEIENQSFDIVNEIFAPIHPSKLKYVDRLSTCGWILLYRKMTV